MTIKQRLGRWLIPKLPISRFVFDLIRSEWNAWLVRQGWKFLPHKWMELRRLRQLQDIYVNVASGGCLLDNFVHLDLYGGAKSVVKWDCMRSLPFSTDSCSGIRVEHFVEHIEPRDDLPRFLTDCHRALQPGKVLRVIVPDVEQFLRAYSSNEIDGFAELGFAQPLPHDLPTKMDVVNHMFHQWHEHRWGYDFETLSHRLTAAGFKLVTRTKFGESLDPILANDRPHHAPYSLYVDAKK